MVKVTVNFSDMEFRELMNAVDIELGKMQDLLEEDPGDTIIAAIVEDLRNVALKLDPEFVGRMGARV